MSASKNPTGVEIDIISEACPILPNVTKTQQDNGM